MGWIGALVAGAFLTVSTAEGADSSAAEPESVSACEEAFALRPADSETALCFYRLAKDESAPGRAARAEAALEDLARRNPDLPWLSYQLANLRYWDAEVAEVLFQTAAEGFHSLGDTENEINSRISRSRRLRRLGREEDARREVETLTELARRSEVPRLRAIGVIEEARQLLHDGRELERAYETLKELEVPPGTDGSFARSERLLLLSNVSMQIGRWDEASAASEALIAIALETGKEPLEAVSRYQLAWAAFERLSEEPTPSRHREAERLAREAAETSRRAGHDTAELKSEWMLGFLMPFEEREPHWRRCLELAETADLESYCLSGLALWQAKSDPARARELASESISLAETTESAWWPIFAWRASMRILWGAVDPQRALGDSWEALDAIETLRKRQGEELGGARLFSVWSDDYAWLAGQLFEHAERQSDSGWALSEAFRVSERMRARALDDWLRRAGREGGEAAIIARPMEAFASFETVRQALGPGEALVSFQVAPWEDFLGEPAGGSWAVVVTRDRLGVHRLPGRLDIRQRVRSLEGAVTHREGDRANEVAATVLVYQDLLAEALSGLPPGIDRLILVPDDALHRLPFAALRASEDGEPLGSRYELVQVPSATLWLRWRQAKPEPAEQPLLVLADPDLPRDEAAAETPLQVAQTREAAETYGRLPWARKEGDAAKRALGRGTVLIGAEASEAALRALAPGKCGIVHLGAHAVTNEDRPELSAVLLAPSPGGSEPADQVADGEDDPSDGYLRSAEIARLDLSGLTVVLASCRSAGGSTLRGEGVMSLGRAFFQAGAHGVVASLWPLRDDESAAMFERFYDHLGRGESVAGALRSARREAIAAGEPAAAWAGLVVLGDGSAVPLPGGRRLLDHPAVAVVVPAVLVLAAVLLAVFAVRRRPAAPTA